MKTPATVFVAAALSAIAVPLRADPEMPEGFVAEWRDESGFGWRETGRVGLPLAEAVSLLAGTMKAQGYRLKHDIFDEKSPNPDRHLFLWVKSGEEATVMAWAVGAAVTGISWGVTRPGATPAHRGTQETVSDSENNARQQTKNDNDMKTTQSPVRKLRRAAPPLVAAAVAAAAVFVPTSAPAGSYAISDDLADATRALDVLPNLEGKTDEEVEKLLGANPDLARKVDEAEAKVADALARIGGDSGIEQARLILQDLPDFGGMTDSEIREYLAANPDQARKIEEASRLLSGKDGAESGGSSGEAGSGGSGDNSGGSSQDAGDGEDWAGAGDGGSSTNVLDDVYFGELKWDFGGFKAEDAEKGEVCISGLKMQRDGLRFKYVRDLSEWGVANPEDASEALACLFVLDCDGKWVGGKFDWISSSRETRDFKNVYSGYNGWDLSNVPNPTIASFVIVHKDGKRRSNVISAMWER